MDDAIVALVRSLVAVVPALGAWLAGLIDGKDEQPAFTRRVREVIPSPNASRKVEDKLRAEQR